ncbi:MAG: hypothetical protein KAX80_11825, partial [Planctomycetes bacterium]|nr:hypothetical protein [Planctomycetota bacterium]
MHWLRVRLKAAYRKFPGVGFVAGLFGCGLLVFAGVLHWEWGMFVLFPFLNGLAYVLAPREVWGGRAYWTLAGLWLGAAVLGLLAHWTTLDPYTPWLSLARYLLFLAAFLTAQLSGLTGHPEFSAREEPKLKRCSAKVALLLALLLQLLSVGFIVYLIPLEWAMAPRYRGLQVERVWTVRQGDIVHNVAWSPGSRYLAAQTDRGIWVVDPAQREATRVAERGYFSSQPWLVSGKGLLFKRWEDEGGGIWFAGPPDWKAELVDESPGAWSPACSPTEDHVALVLESAEADKRCDIWVMKADWSKGWPLVQDGGWPVWSPEGGHVLFVRSSAYQGKVEPWVTDLDGNAEPIPLDLDLGAIPRGHLTWLSEDSLALVTPEGKPDDGGLRKWLLSGSGGQVVIGVWDLKGSGRESFRARQLLDLDLLTTLAARQGAKQVALSGGLTGILPGAGGACYLWDPPSGRLWRVPAAVDLASALAWSPDGNALAISGTAYSV